MAKDCPKSQKHQGHNVSKPAKASAKNSRTEPAPSGSKQPGSSSHLRDLCVKLNRLKQTFVPPVVSGKD